MREYYQGKGNKGGAMIDVSKYEKVGEYRNGEMIWISPKNENMVYLISFGNEFYIGSSVNIRNRFQSFTSFLKRGKCKSPKVQSAFDVNSGFDLFAIECTDKDNLRKREEFYINTMHPSLNIRKRADYMYRDSMTPSQRRCKRDKKSSNAVIDHKALPVFHKTADDIDASYAEPTKGVQTYIPMSVYRRLNDIKLTRRENIATLVAEAIVYWLDAKEIKVELK